MCDLITHVVTWGCGFESWPSSLHIRAGGGGFALTSPGKAVMETGQMS